MKTRMLGSVTRSWSCMGSDHKAHALSTRWPHSGGSLAELAVPFTCSQVQGLFSPISVGYCATGGRKLALCLCSVFLGLLCVLYSQSGPCSFTADPWPLTGPVHP